MKRDLTALSNQAFDLLVIGGGIHGACVAWDATLRGLSVALVEQADFASGTSANSLKVIHGGLRYLQTADFKRMRQSIRERQTLMRIAPHLVHPMPVLVPTYGHGAKGKEAMAIALRINDLISYDRNLSLSDPQKHIPHGRIMSKQECLEQLPKLPTQGLTGAAYFHDAQMYNSEQLVLAFLRSADQRGAQIANYARAVSFITNDDRVTGTIIEDQLTSNRFTIQANATINASGPWIDQLLAAASDCAVEPKPLVKAMNLVTRPLFGSQQNCAVGISGRDRGSRLLFIAPWRERSLVGTWYGPDDHQAKPPGVDKAEVKSFIADVNQAYPGFNLTPDAVQWVHSGLLPSDGLCAKSKEMKSTKHFQLKDHRTDGLRGLLSIRGVKYTTARDIACKAVDWVFRDQGKMIPASCSHTEPLFGGNIEQFKPFVATALNKHRGKVSHVALKQLVYNYGSAYEDVLRHIEPPNTALPSKNHIQNDQAVLTAEVKYSVQNTMARTLNDVVFRRTELGAIGHPGSEALQLCAQVMGHELGWSAEKRHCELAHVEQRFWQLFS